MGENKSKMSVRGNHELGKILTSWKQALKILRAVKKANAKFGTEYYVEMEDVSSDEAIELFKSLRDKQIDSVAKFDCMVSVFGPKVVTKGPKRFLVVQVAHDDTVSISHKLLHKDAVASMHDARGVKVFLCEVLCQLDARA
jgi:hypothetical protein